MGTKTFYEFGLQIYELFFRILKTHEVVEYIHCTHNDEKGDAH